MTDKAPCITWISPGDPPEAFPLLDKAFAEPAGLLAAGGDLSAERLLYAYRHGIFPWYDESQPILWWSPDPRCVLHPGDFHLARRLRRSLKGSGFKISFNSKFSDVIKACAAARKGQPGTWITDDMNAAFLALHEAGWAHSIEVWRDELLIGGLYGMSIGQAFFGESMFSRESNASKSAMLALCVELVSRGFAVLDCQVASPHLQSLGATLMPRQEFALLLEDACKSGFQLELDSVRRPISDYLT